MFACFEFDCGCGLRVCGLVIVRWYDCWVFAGGLCIWFWLSFAGCCDVLVFAITRFCAGLGVGWFILVR